MKKETSMLMFIVAPLLVFMVNMGMMDLQKQKFLLERRQEGSKKMIAAIDNLHSVYKKS